jgi:hypothetical protein
MEIIGCPGRYSPELAGKRDNEEGVSGYVKKDPKGFENPSGLVIGCCGGPHSRLKLAITPCWGKRNGHAIVAGLVDCYFTTLRPG